MPLPDPLTESPGGKVGHPKGDLQSFTLFVVCDCVGERAVPIYNFYSVGPRSTKS